MAVALYMDVHIPKAITIGLRLRDVNIITAQEDKADNLSDPELLDRSTSLQRVLFTFDDDLLAEAAQRQQKGIVFAGLIKFNN
jgi:predicted nuclease of predicted toxin-antitoxin system